MACQYVQCSKCKKKGKACQLGIIGTICRACRELLNKK